MEVSGLQERTAKVIGGRLQATVAVRVVSAGRTPARRGHGAKDLLAVGMWWVAIARSKWPRGRVAG